MRAFIVGSLMLALTVGSATTSLAYASTPSAQDRSVMQNSQPVSHGYADAAEGLGVYYEVFGAGDPIVVLHGGLMEISSLGQVIDALARTRKVIAIDLEGHGRTALRQTPMSHDRNGDDVAAVLRHLGVPRADVAGYSHGGDAAIRMAVRHPDMVRNLIVISTTAARDGWHPEVLQGMEALSAAISPQMQQAPLYHRYVEVAPHPEQFGLLLDRMGDLKRSDYDWRSDIAALETPALLVFADHDAVSTRHIAEFFALFGGGIQDAGYDPFNPRMSRARLAILPGHTHYNLTQGADLARVVEAYLTRPASTTPQGTQQ